MIAIGMLLLGWLLGLLGPEIVYRIRTQRRLAAINRGILSEVRDVALRVAIAGDMIEDMRGRFGRETVNRICGAYAAFQRGEEDAKAYESLKAIAALSDDDLENLRLVRLSQQPNGLGLRKFRLPFIDSKISELELFGEERMAQLLDFRAQLEQFNELTDEARAHMKMTFEARGNNHAIVQRNLESTYDGASRKTRTIVERAKAIVLE